MPGFLGSGCDHNESLSTTLIYGHEGRGPSLILKKQRPKAMPGLVKITFPSGGGNGKGFVQNVATS